MAKEKTKNIRREIKVNGVATGEYEIIQNIQNLPTVIPDNLTESYTWTTAARNFNIYAERFCDAISQAIVQEQSGCFSCGILDVRQLGGGDHQIMLELKRVLPNDTSSDFKLVRKTLIQLNSIVFEIKEGNVWKARNLISHIDFDESNTISTFRISDEIWTLFKSVKHGYRLYNPVVAYLVCPNAYRVYKIICRQTNPLVFNLADFRKMLGINDAKYKRTCDLSLRYLDRIKDDLFLNAEWSFDYEFSSSESSRGKRGRPVVDTITLFPIRNDSYLEISRHSDKIVNSGYDAFLPEKFRDYLKHKYEFTNKEIKDSLVIAPACAIMIQGNENPLELLLDSTEKIDSSKDKKSYVIGLLRKHVYDKYGEFLGSEKAIEAFMARRARTEE